MADSSIDRLEIEVQAQAAKANAELDKLVGKLQAMSASLSKLNTGGLQGLANGVTKLGQAMQSMNNIKTTDFTRLANNIQKLGSINQAGINGTASALRQISSALSTTSSAANSIQGIADLAKSVSKLGSKGVSNAITNLPALAKSMREFMQTLSTAPQVSQNIIQMTNAMANLASQGSKYNSTIKSMGNAAKNLGKAHQNAYKSNVNFLASLSKLTVGFYILRRAVRAAWGPIQEAMDFGETINLFQTSFKKIGMEAAQEAGMSWGSEAANAYALSFVDEAQKFNDKITQALSLDPNTIMNYQAVFAQMANAFGLTTSSVQDLSESFTLLGLDIASFFNTGVEEAMVKLRAGLAGETEPLRTLGVDITEATLKMTAMRYGITGTISEMSQAAKTQLRWLAIMDQTETVFGDMAKTIQSPANQMRILQQQWENFTRTLGQIFIPMVTTVLPYINAFVIALQRMASVIAGAMGYELPDYTGSDIYKDITGDIEGIGDASDEANKSVNKLQKSLASFDVLNNQSSSANAAGSNLLGGGFPVLDDAIAKKTESYMAKFNDELSKMSNNAKDMADNIVGVFKKISEKAAPTTSALKKLWDNGLRPIAGFVGTDIINWYEKFLVPVGSWALGKGIPALADALADLLSEIDWNKLNSALGDLYDALSPMVIGIGQGLVNFVTDLSGVLKPVVAATANLLADAIGAIADSIGNVDSKTWEDAGYAIGVIATAVAGIKIVNGLSKFLLELGAGLETIVTALSNLSYMNPIALPALFDLLGFDEWANALYNKLPEWVKNLWEGFWDVVEQAFKDIFNYDYLFKLTEDFIETWNKVFNPGDDTWYEIAGNIVKGLGQGLLIAIDFIFEPINDLFKSIVKHIKEVFGINSPAKAMMPYGEYILLGLIQGIQDGWENKWSDFKSWLSGLPTLIASGFGSLTAHFEAKGAQIISGIKGGWNDGWKTFKEWLNSIPGKISSGIGSLYNIGQELIKSFIKGFQSLDIKLPHFSFEGSINPVDWVKNGSLPSIDVSWYANGGQPNLGEMFIARERGPELVGTLGGHTTVANNTQIEAGIEEAAYRGYIRAIRETSGSNNQSGDTIVNIDGKEVFRATQKASKEYYKMTGRSPFPVSGTGV